MLITFCWTILYSFFGLKLLISFKIFENLSLFTVVYTLPNLMYKLIYKWINESYSISVKHTADNVNCVGLCKHLLDEWILLNKKKKLAKGTGCSGHQETRNGTEKEEEVNGEKWKKDPKLPLLEVAQKVESNEMSVYENWRVILASRSDLKMPWGGRENSSIMGSRKTASSVEQEDCPTVYAPHKNQIHAAKREMQICQFLIPLAVLMLD